MYQENKWLQYSKKVQCSESKHTELEETKAEADECQLHPKIFQWPHALAFARITTGNWWVCGLEEKDWNANYTWDNTE